MDALSLLADEVFIRYAVEDLQEPGGKAVLLRLDTDHISLADRNVVELVEAEPACRHRTCNSLRVGYDNPCITTPTAIGREDSSPTRAARSRGRACATANTVDTSTRSAP